VPKKTKEELPPAVGDYVFPPLDLLAFPTKIDSVQTRDELLNNAHTLEERLAEFDVQGNVVEINPGPVITRYEYEPAPGIKVSRITALADDLALAMRAKRIRIVAPIPGKAAVGVELPNPEPQLVYLRKIIDTEAFRQSASPLTIALGETISGQTYVTSLDRMPHLLVAGATGSGKSVCLNAILASMLYKAHPSQVDFVLVDPKRLELSTYRKLRFHHLTFREDLDEEVVTTAANALAVLRSLEWEMENRYSLLARAGVRNITEYNTRLKEGKLQEEEGAPPLKPLPFTVLVIDELADLMLTAAKEVEEPIARLTQMSRAVGIHLIVATQRPSVDVITGVIKANFPARIAFQVASKIDSRTILDMNGAEKLLGNGDMLFLPPASPEPVRRAG
jgi:S-DNA-T family DNA segregation ATPase FtsK/SpoIIIE